MLVFLLILVLITLLYNHGIRNFNYWEKKGIKYCKPVPFFGNSLRKYLQMISPTDLYIEFYKRFPSERFVGSFESNHLTLVIRDPDLVKHILVTDFRYFSSKGINIHKVEPLLDNLFTADGDLWKLLRQKMTASFSTGKLKSMFPIIVEITERMQKIIAKAAENGTETNVRDLLARYSTDVTTACGFGIDTDSLNDDSSVFRQLGKRIFTIKVRDAFVIMFKLIAPGLCKNLHVFSSEVESTMVSIVKNIIEAKELKPSTRMDFVDTLLEMQQKGKIVGESMMRQDSNGKPEQAEVILNDTLIVSQAFILFAAAYETSSAAMSYALHQLAFHPDEQIKCQNEIDEVLYRHGDITYDAIREMKRLERAFQEAMRMNSPISFLMRQCVKKYTFPGTDLTIDEGVVVFIPIQAMQNDEKYFKEPNKFMPDRFLPDNVRSVKNHVYLPFGEGPRACIGSRLGNLMSIAGLASILCQFTVVPSENSRQRLLTESSTLIIQNVKGGIPLAFVPRNKI